MEELEFLLESDENILEAEICDVQTTKGEEFGISMTIGLSEKQISERVLDNTKAQTFDQIEIVLTEKQLRKILKTIKEYK